MRFEMLDHLAFGLRHEAQAFPITCQSGQCPDCKRAAVPQWIYQAGTAAEFTDAFRAPSQVIALFTCRLEQGRACRGSPGDDSLAVIQRLGRNFAGVIDPHEPGDARPLRVGARDGFEPWR